MATGCGTGCSNLFGETTNDNQVIYTGPSIPALSICNGDQLSSVEAVIFQAILNYSTGVGIEIPNINYGTCGLFTQFVTCCNTGTAPKDLDTLMQNIFTALCTLYT